MNASDEPWTATISIRPGRPDLARMLERALRPEAEREVPRARAELRRVSDDRLELEIRACDVGAMRAALNTHLGWIQLSLSTVRAAARSGPPEASGH